MDIGAVWIVVVQRPNVTLFAVAAVVGVEPIVRSRTCAIGHRFMQGSVEEGVGSIDYVWGLIPETGEVVFEVVEVVDGLYGAVVDHFVVFFNSEDDIGP